jgi:hypothetical protein
MALLLYLPPLLAILSLPVPCFVLIDLRAINSCTTSVPLGFYPDGTAVQPAFPGTSQHCFNPQRDEF